MKVLTTAGLTKLIQLCKSAFVDKTDVVETQTVTLATVATSGSYNDLSNKPNIPTVNNATLTIQKNGTTVKTFTANASSNVTANITVPTNNNQLTNGAGYITGITSAMVTTALGYTPYDASNPNGYTSNTGTVTSVNSVSPVNGNVSLSIPTVNNPTITITQGGVTKGSFTLNQSAGDTIALDAGGGSSVAVGTVLPFAGATAPTGYLLCDGSAISRTTYSALFDVIGTTYGSGDGSTTFNIPDLTYRQVGATVGVRGDDKAIGFTDGTENYGLRARAVSASNGFLYVNKLVYGGNVGDSDSNVQSANTPDNGTFLGITKDSTKSGIIADLSSATTLNMIIKY